jgi:hypothetical protein
MIRNQNHSIDIDKFHETIDSHEYVNPDRFPHSGSKVQICFGVSSRKEQVS